MGHEGQVYMACIISCLLYGCQTWAMRVELESKTEMMEMRMVRWMCGVSPKERQPSTELRRRLGVEATGDVMRRGRLRWHGHVERKHNADYVKTCTRLVVEGKAPVVRPRKTWQNTHVLGWWWRGRLLSSGRGRPGRTLMY